jgi:hypothetical protein
MESGLVMLLHSTVIGIILYTIMKFVLSQDDRIAQDRSILLASITLTYMILFGHGLPTSINRNIMG